MGRKIWLIYIYIYILVLVSVLCINPWTAYTEEIKQLWKVLFISTWNNKNKKNNHNELKSNQYGQVEDDDPIYFSWYWTSMQEPLSNFH